MQLRLRVGVLGQQGLQAGELVLLVLFPHLKPILLPFNLGVNALQSRVLHYIRVHYRDGPVFQRDVEGVFSLSRSTATGILQHLEREGFIFRESVQEDGRLKSLVPTEKAAELDEQVRASLLAIEAKMTDGISPGQLQVFMETASKMSSNLDG